MNSIASVFARLVLVTLAFVPLNACALSGGPLKGKVLEARTERPIAGAIVVARWQGYLASFAHGRTVCVHVESTVTDANGAYRVPAWRKPSDIGWVQDLQPHVFAYKNGYQWSHTSKKEDVQYLEKFAGTTKERLAYLLRASSSTRCRAAAESEKQLLPLKRAVYREAAAIASADKEDQEKLETLLFGVEALELGSIEALNRMTERRKVKK